MISKNEETRRAACSCGQLHLDVCGDPLRLSICHCFECQKRTGSVFGAQARFLKESVAINGDSTEYTRKADSGNDITFNFCPRCGSTVYYWLEQEPDTIGVPVGVFADPNFPAPKFSVYESRRHLWVQVPEYAEHND